MAVVPVTVATGVKAGWVRRKLTRYSSASVTASHDTASDVADPATGSTRRPARVMSPSSSSVTVTVTSGTVTEP